MNGILSGLMSLASTFATGSLNGAAFFTPSSGGKESPTSFLSMLESANGGGQRAESNGFDQNLGKMKAYNSVNTGDLTNTSMLATSNVICPQTDGAAVSAVAEVGNEYKATNTQTKEKVVKKSSSTAGENQTQVITVADSAQKLGLSPDQVNKIASVLNTTPEGLAKIQITITNGAISGISGVVDGAKVLEKIAGLLNLDSPQAKEFFNSLGISSMEIKGIASIDAGNGGVKTDMVSPQAEVGGNSLGGFGNNGGNMTPFKNSSENNGLAGVGGTFDILGVSANPNSAASLTDATFTPAGVGADGKIMGQILEKASILSLPNGTETSIKLSPESLGSVDIKLSMNDASVKASIMVENHAVKQVVEQNLDQLKTALQQQGIAVNQMSVSVNQQGNQSFGNGASFGQNFDPLSGIDNGGQANQADMSLVTRINRISTVNGRTLVDVTA